MTEIHQLNPERMQAEPPLSPGQISLYVVEHGAAGVCEACGSKDWAAHDERDENAAATLGLAKLDNPDVRGIKPIVTLTCRHCGCIRAFARKRVADWVAKAKTGGDGG